jgi:hypothetical protein
VIVLSKRNGDVPVFRQYYRVGWGLAADVEPSTTARVPFTVGGPPDVLAALANDYRFLPVPDGYAFSDYQAAMLAALDRWHDTWTQTVTIAGTTYALNASPDSQTLFDKMKLAMQGLPDQTEQFDLYTSARRAGPFAASDIASALVDYGNTLLRRETQGPGSFNALYFSILGAQSAADLDAITFG